MLAIQSATITRALSKTWAGKFGFGSAARLSKPDNRSVKSSNSCCTPLHFSFGKLLVADEGESARVLLDVVECGAEAGKKARDFASKIKTQSKRFPAIQESLPLRRLQARRHYETVIGEAESALSLAMDAVIAARANLIHIDRINMSRSNLHEYWTIVRRNKIEDANNASEVTARKLAEPHR